MLNLNSSTAASHYASLLAGRCSYCNSPTHHGPWSREQLDEAKAGIGMASDDDFVDLCDRCFVNEVCAGDARQAEKLTGRKMPIKPSLWSDEIQEAAMRILGGCQVPPAQPTRRRTAASDKWWALEGVCGNVYKTKAGLVDDIRAINNGAVLNEPLCTLDRTFMVDVLKHHYDWQAKRGAGIAHIEVRMNPSHTGSTRGLWIKRLDGSEVDISWVVALKPGGQSSAKENVCAAARREIFDQVLAARAAQEGKCCPMCGEPLLRKTHVDHAAPNTFDSILTGFLSAYGHSYDSISVQDYGTYSLFDDRGLAADWRQYHAQLADLRLIHAHENLSLGRQL